MTDSEKKLVKLIKKIKRNRFLFYAITAIYFALNIALSFGGIYCFAKGYPEYAIVLYIGTFIHTLAYFNAKDETIRNDIDLSANVFKAFCECADEFKHEIIKRSNIDISECEKLAKKLPESDEE